jgi:cell wall-associated NlpC family hydrolase
VDKLDEVFGTFMAHAVDFELVDYDERIPGDVLMFRLQGVPVHAGVVVDNDKMIHSLPGHACVFEQYSGVRWRRRIEGVYRWVS